jgi:hypothetical protein
MNIKHGILGLVVGLSAVALVACAETPQKEAKEMADEQKAAADKIAKAEKEAADKTAKAQKEADEKTAKANKDLEEKKADVNKDLSEELADIKYKNFVALTDYKLLVTNRLADQEKKFTELKIKGDAKAATMTADAKKEWTESVNAADRELKQAREDLKTLDTVTEPTWAAAKAKIDADVTSFAKSVDTLGKKI